MSASARSNCTFPLGASSALALAALIAAAPGLAQDGGPSAPATCGSTLTEEGACFGDVAAWCSAPNEGGESPNAAVESLDCGTRGGSCVEHGEIGAWCRVPDGEPCAAAAPGGTAQLLCGDASASPGPGCDLEAGCVDDAPDCQAGEPPTCRDSALVLGCSRAGQSLFVRCPSGCQGGACRDLPAGSVCDGSGLLRCAAGLACLDAEEGGFGRCLAVDGGPAPDTPPSTQPPAEVTGCRCTATPAGHGAFAALLLPVLLAFARRRRGNRLFSGPLAWQTPEAGLSTGSPGKNSSQ